MINWQRGKLIMKDLAIDRSLIQVGIGDLLQTDDECCNSCEEVREAYRKKGWAMTNTDLIDQVDIQTSFILLPARWNRMMRFSE